MNVAPVNKGVFSRIAPKLNGKTKEGEVIGMKGSRLCLGIAIGTVAAYFLLLSTMQRRYA